MAEITEFAHGYAYGDYSGVVFSTLPTLGRAGARLAISNGYLRPLFLSILESTRESECVPKLVDEWNTLTGWCGVGVGKVELTEQLAIEIERAIGAVTRANLIAHLEHADVEDCLRCAQCVVAFICEQVTRGLSLFIEDE